MGCHFTDPAQRRDPVLQQQWCGPKAIRRRRIPSGDGQYHPFRVKFCRLIHQISKDLLYYICKISNITRYQWIYGFTIKLITRYQSLKPALWRLARAWLVQDVLQRPHLRCVLNHLYRRCFVLYRIRSGSIQWWNQHGFTVLPEKKTTERPNVLEITWPNIWSNESTLNKHVCWVFQHHNGIVVQPFDGCTDDKPTVRSPTLIGQPTNLEISLHFAWWSCFLGWCI